ncbi:hypothetical protein [Marinisporobacter balticus]|uniref:Uncharacterized protein n=1 Tax=Marinisporobacter balticus TaxID=2018667 RepID=A0A4R2K5K5_9FIRM|nr:hypothetical protein [Marinisporobacter balticus]TCO68521.1 hypothetical protein EV214_14313 [Marinisporobacter balticus]
MGKNKFKVIKGTKNQDIDRAYRFIKADVTNTRLMGVVGLRITWEREDGQLFHQFFHLDAEEYGLDDYESSIGGDRKQLGTIAAKMMGGLGGDFVSINESDAKYLLQRFVCKNKKNGSPLPDLEWEYNFMLKEDVNLSEEEKQRLWGKICEEIHSPTQIINYFIMRSVGMDDEAIAYLSLNNEIDYKLVNKPSTLLKNVIEMDQDGQGFTYITESLIDEEDEYKMVVSEIKIIHKENKVKVEKAEIKSIMKITGREAAFALLKKEHLLVYDVRDMGKVMGLLEKEKPHAMKNSYEFGYLYTEFNPTNAHVNCKTYYLNEDIYGIYYITTADQLVVAAYDQEKIDKIENDLENIFGESIELEEIMDLDNSLLYEFVHSAYDNIFDFLDEE